MVYKFDCKNCSATYIGETKRSLRTRINEHKTNKNKESVVSLHRIENKHEFDWDNTFVLDMESNYKKRLVSEMIYIKSNHNSIIKKEDIQNLSTMYFPIINEFNTV